MPASAHENRLVVLAPAANDAAAVAAMLQQHELEAMVGRDAPHACALLEQGAGVLLLTEEALELPEAGKILDALKVQPAWSELPVIILTSGGPARLARLLEITAAARGSMTLLERPINSALLLRSLHVALNARRRQYQVRQLLEDQETRRRQLERANEVAVQTQEALRDAQNQIRHYAEGLEKTVAERTAKLRETIEELEAFSYSMAHDMRAPLRSMMGYAAVLREDHADELTDQGKEFLRRIGLSARRLDQLIQDVLSYSRIVRGELPLEPIDLGELTADVIESYPNLHAVRECVRVDGALPVVVGNRAALTQVLSNLMGNAVKFVTKNRAPCVRIRAEPAAAEARPGEAWVRVWVEDNGVGIDSAARGKLFQMFQQFTPHGVYEGTGMGLAIARKAIERMGGMIGFESVVGEGSQFWFELPAAGDRAMQPG